MATTYELIDKTTLTGTQSTVSFTSIDSSYTDLVLKISARSSYSNGYDQMRISFNGSSSSFSAKYLLGTGSSAVSGNTVPQLIGHADAATATSNTFNNAEVYIPNYTSSNYKSFSADNVQEDNTSLALVSFTANLWSNTAAINQITLALEIGSYVSGSSFYLYGIKNS